MALKDFWESRVLNNDKRILSNRIIKDILFYGLMVLCFVILLVLRPIHSPEGTIYAVVLAIVIVIVRFILKCLEKHRPEEFHWFWENMEWLLKLINAVLDMLGKPPIPLLNKGN